LDRVRSCYIVHVLACAALACPPAAAAQAAAGTDAGDRATDAPPSVMGDVVRGGRLVVHGLTAPVRWTREQWLATPAALVFLGAMSGFDDDAAQLARDGQGSVPDAFFRIVEPIGAEASVALIGSVYAGGWVLDEPELREAAVEAAAASIVAAGVVTPILKVVFGRYRPNEGLGPYEFDPFGGEKSFPSGHTTQAFALMSVLAAHAPSTKLDVLLYGIAAGVGAARIYHDAHFLTDVLGGAAIGTVVGRTMVRKSAALGSTVRPFVGSLGPGEPVLGLSIRF
jgi:membrane-associated phospholipid phosphatase